MMMLSCQQLRPQAQSSKPARTKLQPSRAFRFRYFARRTPFAAKERPRLKRLRPPPRDCSRSLSLSLSLIRLRSRDPIRLNRPPEGKNSLSYCARFPPPDSPPPVNATQSSSLGIYYTLTLHAFNHLTARRRSDAFATRRSSSACARVCAHFQLLQQSKACRCDSPFADEVCSRNSTEIAIEKYDLDP